MRSDTLRTLTGAALLLGGCGPSSEVRPGPSGVLPFREDDYPSALAEARERGLPLFIEVWAPWCHTCRSMKAFVFTDESLREQAGRFVWLEVDTDKAQNAAVRRQFPVQALPTYFVVDPRSEQVILRWIGGASVAQLGDLLDDAHARFERARAGAAPEAAARTADDLLAQADLLYGQGRNEEAAQVVERALAAAGEGWPSYARAVEMLLVARTLEGRNEEGARLAREALPRLSSTPSVAVVAGAGLECALALPDGEAKRELASFLEDAGRRAAADAAIPMAADDRSSLYMTLVSARQAARDSVGARALAEEWAAFLERTAAAAPTPAARTVFDSHRLSACLELGVPEKALPFLSRSERDFPDDYNPPARLAAAYRAMRRWDEAIAASDRAIERAYGPRLLRILESRAQIFLDMGDLIGARTTLEDAVRRAEALPEGQRSERTLAGLRKKLESVPVVSR
jgi:thioredoxin-like negative regulator of GroEL